MDINEYIPWFKQRYKNTSSFPTVVAFIITDFLTIMLCIGAGFFIVNAVDVHFINFRSFVNYWVYLPIFFVIYNIFKLYPGIYLIPSEQIRNFFIANAVMFIGIAISIWVETDGRSYVAIAFLIAFVFSIFAVPASRYIAKHFVFGGLSWWGIPAVLYCDVSKIENTTKNLIRNYRSGYKVVAIVHTGEHPKLVASNYEGIPVIHSIDTSTQLNTVLHIKTAIIVQDKENLQYYSILKKTISCFRYTIVIPEVNYLNTVSMQVREINGEIAFFTTHQLTKWHNLFFKRFFDVLCLILVFPFVLPVFIVIALCIKVLDPGPVFYRHARLGQNGVPLHVWKFRTMKINAEQELEALLNSEPAIRTEWETSYKLKNDPRITKFGKFLRKTSLDELPQLFNVLCNEMSLIGPRPVTADEQDKYKDSFNYIFSVKPGLSGMWQVSGRSDTDYDERIAFDSYYIQNWSLWLDMWLFMKTVAVVLTGKGAR